MIKQLNLTNFQVHTKISLLFTEGLNVIIGSSEMGKSSIVRALHWICLNKPKGDSFRTHGTKKTVVELKTNTGDVVRTKSASVNEYKTSEGVSSNFGTTIPPDVRKSLPLTALNFQTQHESVFLLSDSAGEVGRKLSRYVNLEIIDRLVKSFKRKKQLAEERKISIAQEVLDIKKELETIPNLDMMDKDVDELVKYDAKISNLNVSILDLEEKADWIASLLKDCEVYAYVKELLTIIDELMSDEKKIKELKLREKALQDIFDTGRGINLSLNSLQNIGPFLDEIDVLVEMASKQKKRKQEEKELDSFLWEYGDKKGRATILFEKISEFEIELKNNLKECPLCGRRD